MGLKDEETSQFLKFRSEGEEIRMEIAAKKETKERARGEEAKGIPRCSSSFLMKTGRRGSRAL